MNTLTFCFDHPVAVKAFFSCLSDPIKTTAIRFLRSSEDGSLVVPVDDLPDGAWKIMLEWNHEGRDFCMERQFKLDGAVVT